MDVDLVPEESMDTDTAVADTIGRILTDIENGTVMDHSEPGTVNGTDPPKVKLEKEEGTSSQKRAPPDKDKEPIVIDLSDDEDEDCKENTNTEQSPVPVKALKSLLKELTLERSAELLAKIRLAVSALPRDTLEDLYLSKVQETYEMGQCLQKLEQKVTSYLRYKDRVTFKAQCLQGQLTDSARAMVVVTDQLTRNPKNALKACNPTPLKFQRTVGIQCRNDPLPRLKGGPLGNSTVLNAPLPTLASSSTSGNVEQKRGPPGIPAKNGIIPIPSMTSLILPGQKRPTVSIDTARTPVPQTEVTPPKVPRRPGPASVVRAAQVAAAAYQNQNQTAPANGGGGSYTTLTNGGGSHSKGTDSASSNQKKTIVSQNGVQYQVGVSQVSQEYTIVQSAACGSYQLLTNQTTQGRTLIVQQPQRGSSGQPIAVRQQVTTQNQNFRTNVTLPTRSGVLQNQRPSTTGPGPNGRQMGPRPPTLNNHSVVARTLGTPNFMPKFILPELPAMSTQPKKPKEAPPPPTLTLQEQGGGIVLSWTHISSAIYAEIQSYQIFACQEPVFSTANGLGKVFPTPIWKRVGDVKALPLPMACTLSQFTEENRYHFIVRGVDVYNRTGQFCEVMDILLKKRK